MTSRIDLVTVGSLFVEITPSTPGEMLSTARDYTLVPSGAAANMVFALARLGVGVRFITAVGDDDFGTLVERELADFGVDTTSVRRAPGHLTPVSFCAVDRQGGKRFRFYRFPGWCSPMQALTADDFQPVSTARLFDFGEGSIRETALRPLVIAAARCARAAGAIVLYAVNLRRSAWGDLAEATIQEIQREAIALADIVTLNEEEVTFITGISGEDGLRRVQALGPRVAVLTRGGEGDMLVRVGEEQASIPPFKVPVVYDIGAGDTFHAGLVAAALHRAMDVMTLSEWAEAVRFGAATAAIRVSTSADPRDLPTFSTVESWLASHS